MVHAEGCRRVDITAIAHHGSTLRTLVLSKGWSHSFVPINSDLAGMLSQCPNIEQLCLDLYDLQPNVRDENDVDFVAPPPNCASAKSPFEVALTAIAKLSKLHTLRITDPKAYRSGTNLRLTITEEQNGVIRSGSQRHHFHTAANALMQYLNDHGSKVKLLAFSPIDEFTACRDPDLNGHFWPHYYYYKATFTDCFGNNTAVARPLKLWKLDFPESWILSQFCSELA
jgi:hypothetical protein